VKRSLSPFLRLLFTPLRLFLIRFFLIDYVRLQYRFITGNPLHLNPPKKYTEKLQYLRIFIFPKDPLVIQCTDRVRLIDYIKSLKLDRYLIPQLGIYKKPQEIDFTALPDWFVIKSNHGSGFNLIIKKANGFNKKKLFGTLSRWLRTDYGTLTGEHHYSSIPPRLIIEPYLGIEESLPIEYKIHVFNGQAKYLYVVTGRPYQLRYTHFLIDWTPFPGAQFNGWKSSEYPPVKPENFEEMVRLAETLAEPFDFVRVDLYSIKGKIYISELTFTPAKGTLSLVDRHIDTQMGEWLTIHEK
jgi:hypothetical protein